MAQLKVAWCCRWNLIAFFKICFYFVCFVCLFVCFFFSGCLRWVYQEKCNSMNLDLAFWANLIIRLDAVWKPIGISEECNVALIYSSPYGQTWLSDQLKIKRLNLMQHWQTNCIFWCYCSLNTFHLNDGTLEFVQRRLSKRELQQRYSTNYWREMPSTLSMYSFETSGFYFSLKFHSTPRALLIF